MKKIKYVQIFEIKRVVVEEHRLQDNVKIYVDPKLPAPFKEDEGSELHLEFNCPAGKGLIYVKQHICPSPQVIHLSKQETKILT